MIGLIDCRRGGDAPRADMDEMAKHFEDSTGASLDRLRRHGVAISWRMQERYAVSLLESIRLLRSASWAQHIRGQYVVVVKNGTPQYLPNVWRSEFQTEECF